jgi:outer membrane protein assembly factor BamA
VGGTLVGEGHEGFGSIPSQTYFAPNVALVGDNSQSAFTSPISGGRYRFEITPTIGTFTMQTVYADWRRYFFARPFTLAIRGMHAGRYGKDADSRLLYPLYLGDELLIRGYGYNSFTQDECSAQSGGSSCPVFDRLMGTRMLVANAELRIPLLGVPEYGLINFPEFATHISPFIDAGLAYTSDQHPSFRFTRNATTGSCAPSNGSSTGNPADIIISCAERVPVISTGVSARINVLGYMIFEAYMAHPFQRPSKNWVWGFQLAPGW